MCSNPYRLGVAEYGCGQCLPCRINRRRVWVSRMMLEMQQHAHSWFVTLTYDDAHLPEDKSVSKRELQLFMKRLRRTAFGDKIRFFGVGEYGDISQRPHYHIILFGLADPGVVQQSWSFGMVHVGTLTEASAGYVCGYVTKGMGKRGDARLAGRHPEFAIMSRRPGIGAGAAEEIARVVTSKGGARYVVQNGDVPGVVRAGGSKWPLGRYMLEKVRREAGYSVPGPDGKFQSQLSNASYHLKLQELQLWFRTVPGSRDLHEQKRVQSARRAAARERITRSKKGIGQ